MNTLTQWSVKFEGKELYIEAFFTVVLMLMYCGYSFIESCPDGSGFVLKAPYVTNRMLFHTYPTDVDSVMKNIRIARNKMFVKKICFVVPYLILQVIN